MAVRCGPATALPRVATITLNAEEGRLTTAANVDTFSGVIGGSGVLTSTGAGHWFSAATTTMPVDFAVANGTWKSGAQRRCDWQYRHNGTLIFSRRRELSAPGDLSGNGSFTKGGPGNLTLTGNSSGYTGPATVNAGGLYVNGSLGSDSTIIRGTLGGSGQ